VVKVDSTDIWDDDLLGFKSRGDAFTNLVTSIDDHRTISIEAGYGRGKTFFRERWAKQLKAAGECVVEIDARLSDHSGDPVVTFLGALLAMVPEADTSKRDAVFSVGKKIAIAGAKAVMREGYKDLAGALAPDEDGKANTLQDIAKSVGQDLSKAAGDLIASQLSAEKARLELGDQLRNLRAQITEGRDTDRIVILIDELDRCHPDYAIALLEAMKLVFDQDGFVFVLMVNTQYLEKIAERRFGERVKGEIYLDKFVDLRLELEPVEEALATATETIALRLPLRIPFGDHEESSIKRAAKLAGQLASVSELSMRQIERILGRVELSLRIYNDVPIDPAMLVFLAFDAKIVDVVDLALLPRMGFATSMSSFEFLMLGDEKEIRTWEVIETVSKKDHFIIEKFPEMATISKVTFRSPTEEDYFLWARVYKHLAPHYIPDHQAMLDAVHKLQVDP
jgi:hypothetical protein